MIFSQDFTSLNKIDIDIIFKYDEYNINFRCYVYYLYYYKINQLILALY